MGTTNVISEVQQPRVYSIGKNPRQISEGMKLTDVYKVPSLFEEFRIADVNQDGNISEKEFELYDKKSTLKEEYRKSTVKHNKFNKNHAIGGAAFIASSIGAVSCKALALGAIISPLFAVAAVGAVGFILYECMKNQKACDNDKKVLDEKIKELDKQYQPKIAAETK